jgi:phosphotriesterase-related protein
MSHIDRTLFSLADMVQLAQTGCYLEFDLFGQEFSYYPLAPIDMPNDAMRVEYLRGLMAAGYREKLVIAQDICHKVHLTKYGGEGYAHILEHVVPIMRRKGMTQDDINIILITNPARILAFV